MTKKPWNAGKSVGQKIKQRREQLNFKPTEFAKKIGITKSGLWELENVSVRPSVELLHKVSDALDAPMLYFLTDCKLNDVDEDVLLMKFRKLDAKNKKLAIEIIKLLTLNT